MIWSSSPWEMGGDTVAVKLRQIEVSRDGEGHEEGSQDTRTRVHAYMPSPNATQPLTNSSCLS